MSKEETQEDIDDMGRGFGKRYNSVNDMLDDLHNENEKLKNRIHEISLAYQCEYEKYTELVKQLKAL